MKSGTRTCFLICPMGSRDSATREKSSKLLQIVSSTVERFGFQTKSFLEPEHRSSIRQKMMELIRSADVCIADLTGDNANVFFEYGWRRALGRPVLAFVEQGHKLLFDVDDYHTARYDVEQPSHAIDAIESFLTDEGFGAPLLQASPKGSNRTSAFANSSSDASLTGLKLCISAFTR